MYSTVAPFLLVTRLGSAMVCEILQNNLECYGITENHIRGHVRRRVNRPHAFPSNRREICLPHGGHAPSHLFLRRSPGFAADDHNIDIITDPRTCSMANQL
ncbi:hypothetical protein BDN71DRAFT_343567 [Pleurotus eryngii]|uniref:Secreted protein n=1 Tax=Pleurotus eryngii TaxID=5323 RepID=A0A9P6DBH4_PLEER|nr:hypothetical protein BDN71DRAFT_343567 [Pleurotus eryngii]